MALSRLEIEAWATRLAAARRESATCTPLSSSIELGLADAYAIQRAGIAIRVGRGEKVVGWKLGYTSLAMRAQMGIDQPNYAPLTDAMLMASGETVRSPLIQPRVEPEIGLRVARPLRGQVSTGEVMDAVGEAFACLEIVDSVFPGYRFRLEDNTADGSSAALVVVGPRLDGLRGLEHVTVTLRHNGEAVESATGAAASGHPAAGVVWLVEELSRHGQHLHAGDLVITGGLTRAIPFTAGDEVDAIFDGVTLVATRRAALPA
ncbi:MAG: fumarylacetoacetate hydrolase family protein [Ilumatobacteraceae bacterium]